MVVSGRWKLFSTDTGLKEDLITKSWWVLGFVASIKTVRKRMVRHGDTVWWSQTELTNGKCERKRNQSFPSELLDKLYAI